MIDNLPEAVENRVRTKKRKRNESNWKQNKRQLLRQNGEEYKTVSGTKIAAKAVHTVKDCTRCKFKCSVKVTVEYR